MKLKIIDFSLRRFKKYIIQNKFRSILVHELQIDMTIVLIIYFDAKQNKEKERKNFHDEKSDTPG